MNPTFTSQGVCFLSVVCLELQLSHSHNLTNFPSCGRTVFYSVTATPYFWSIQGIVGWLVLEGGPQPIEYDNQKLLLTHGAQVVYEYLYDLVCLIAGTVAAVVSCMVSVVVILPLERSYHECNNSSWLLLMNHFQASSEWSCSNSSVLN